MTIENSNLGRWEWEGHRGLIHEKHVRHCHVGILRIGTSIYEASEVSTLRNVQLEGCSADVVEAGPVILDDVSIVGCKVGSLTGNGTMFRRVRLEGVVRHVSLGFRLNPGISAQADVDRWIGVLRRWYESVDWALDIRGADIRDGMLRGIPGDKMIYDHERHFLVDRDRCAAGGWESLAGRSAWSVTCEFVKKSPWTKQLVVAPRSGVGKREFFDALPKLRDAGYVS